MVEVVWNGKYDKAGRRIAPFKVQLPLQTIETVNESTQERQRRLEQFISGREDSEWRNRLIWGDKKYVLPALLEEFRGKVNLIYIDPPFATGADFSFTATIPDSDESFEKEPSMLEQKAYRDTWGRGLDSYLQWFYDTVVLLRELLAEDASIYVHLDDNVGYYAKIILDEVFGSENFKNDVVWKRSNPHNDPQRYGAIHDLIFFYVKTSDYKFNTQHTVASKEYIDSHFASTDQDGRRYALMPLMASGTGSPRRFGDKLLTPPKGTHWRWTQERIDEAMKNGMIVFTSGGTPRYKFYEDESKGRPLQSLWTDIVPINSQSAERVNYPTQKPEALLDRIIRASSKEGDLVLDCFCGSGTAAAVAEKLGRRWIACDLSRFAIQTTRKRLLSIEGLKPLIIQNLGKYERQAWQVAEFGNETGTRVRSYINFVIKLYSATPLNGYVWLHGKKGNRLLHVGSVDSPISPLDVGQIVAEFKRAIGSGKEAPKTNGVDILGWDFAFELNELARQQAEQANVNVRFLRIPREVLDKKAVEQGDVHFFELASLDIGLKTDGMKATLAIKDFVIPPDDVPTDIQKEITHWSQWVDYWAVDWDNKNDTFHNEVQEYRTREKTKLATELSKVYSQHGEYRIVVKVIDILGNDTTKMIILKV